MDIEVVSQSLLTDAIANLEDERGVHCETLIVLLAAVLGTEIFVRNTKGLTQAWQVAPGSAVLLDAVDEEGPEIVEAIRLFAPEFKNAAGIHASGLGS